jgi:hypothetical protein
MIVDDFAPLSRETTARIKVVECLLCGGLVVPLGPRALLVHCLLSRIRL